jgi:SAM-dependent methyltransferase
MLLSEAEWLARQFAGRSNGDLGTVLNIGSSTGAFRQQVQPFIDKLVFAPLRDRGVRVVHVDIKSGGGVDLVADILRDEDMGRLLALKARTIFCSNVIEHVPQRQEFIARLGQLVAEDGTLVVTVPSSYPYHPDPIDNRFRPTLDELAAAFVPLVPVEGTVVSGPTLLEELSGNPKLLARRLLRSVAPLPHPGGWLSTLDRWRWLFRPYQATCIVLDRRSNG